VALLAAGDAGLRRAAARAAGRTGVRDEGSVRLLGSLLPDPDLDVRLAAAGALCAAGERALPALGDLRSAARDPRPSLRVLAVTALGSLGTSLDDAGFRELLAALGDGAPRVRAAAVRALRGQAARAGEALPPLVDGLLGRMTGEDRQEIPETLRAYGERAVDALLARLEVEVQRPRSGCVRTVIVALGDLGPAARKAVPRLEEFLEFPDPPEGARSPPEVVLKRAAREALEKIRGPAAPGGQTPGRKRRASSRPRRRAPVVSAGTSWDNHLPN